MTRSLWNSRWGFILAAAGSAVGLGAIWKFPYVTAHNGGGAFLILYIGFVFTFGLAMMMAEMSLGHATHKSAVGAFRTLGGRTWAVVGYSGILTAFIIMSFYCVVGGWTVAYLVKALDGNILVSDPTRLEQIFNDLISHPVEPLVYHALFMALTAGVVMAGVQSGVERLSKFLMPTLFVLMLILIGRSLTLPGATEGLLTFLVPDFAHVTAVTVISALGLSFFTLSLGMGAMLAYGSYVPRSMSVPNSAVWVVGLTTVACIMSGLIVLPAVSAFGFEPRLGPGLTFMTMPAIFAQMVGGYGFAVLFFFLLVVAALTSAVSLMEVVTAFGVEELGLQRRTAGLLMAFFMFATGIPASLSLGVWREYTLFGLNIFELLDYSTEKILLPLGCVLTALFVGWRVWKLIANQLLENDSHARFWLPAARISYRIIIPVLILWVLLANL